MKLFISFVIAISSSYGASYLPLEMEQQLKEASGVVHGQYSHKSYKKDHNGNVVTEYVFSVNQSAGMKNSQLINRNDFRVMIPGGKWQGVVYNVSGVPSFQVGDEVILLVSKVAGGYRLTNLALGKYDVVREFGKEYLRSSVFPRHRRLGKMSFREFQGLMESALGDRFEEVYKDTYVHKSNKHEARGRMPASIEESQESDGVNPFWFVLCLALLGVYATILFRDYSKDDQE